MVYEQRDSFRKPSYSYGGLRFWNGFGYWLVWWYYRYFYSNRSAQRLSCPDDPCCNQYDTK